MVKHIHVPIPNQRSEFATSHVIEEGAVRTALTIEQGVGRLKRFKRVALRCEKTERNFRSIVSFAAGSYGRKLVRA